MCNNNTPCEWFTVRYFDKAANVIIISLHNVTEQLILLILSPLSTIVVSFSLFVLLADRFSIIMVIGNVICVWKSGFADVLFQSKQTMFNTCIFYPLQVAGRGSETQL